MAYKTGNNHSIHNGNSSHSSIRQCLAYRVKKRRLLRGAFFIAFPFTDKRIGHWLAVVLTRVLLLLLVSQAWADECDLQYFAASRNNTQQVSVKSVIDGDTVRLVDNRLVRFIGINTPEIDHEHGNSEPIAEQARDFLTAVIDKQQGIVKIQYDMERQDRHRRLLAHVFTVDGTNIQAEMLRRGLGAWIVIPPNLKYMNCFRHMEQLARKQNSGVWGAQFKNPRDTWSLTKSDRGFQWMQGKIIRLGKGKKYIWLNFADDVLPDNRPGKRKPYSRVTLRVHKDDLHYFKDYPLDRFVNRTVSVRGWLTQYKKQLVMRLRHPDSIEIIK